MYLTDEEKAMLDGEQGRSRQKCMDLLVSLGEIYDAERLITVRSVHIPGASIMGIGEAGLRFVEEMGGGGTQMLAYATTNASSMPPISPKAAGLNDSQIEQQARLTRAYERMGAYVCNTCTPFLIGNIARPGEHISWGESSAIVYANSVIGARTNREGGPTALASAITGKTPLYGYHLDKNRTATIRVTVKKRLSGITAYGTLGYFVGKFSENDVVVFEGIPPHVTDDELKMLSAAIASSGAVALFHAIGVTSEALTKEQALKGANITSVLEYGTPQEQETSQLLSKAESKEVEWVVFGCPHLSINELREVSRLLDGKKIDPDVTMWVNTSVPMAEYANKLGYSRIIEAAGAQIICETCPVHTPSRTFAQKRGISTITTNSAKMAHYASGQFGLLPHYGDIQQCIRAAITGKWR